MWEENSGRSRMFLRKNGILHIETGFILILTGTAVITMAFGMKDGKVIMNW